MSDIQEEIKEILDYLKIENGTIGSELSYEETHLLLDYITNLQEKVDQYENPEDYTLFYMWLDEKAKDKMKELQEENTKLKELCDKYEEEHKTIFEEWKKDIKEDYKTRIDKTIEYINKNAFDVVNSEHKTIINVEELLNILKGDNK